MEQNWWKNAVIYQCYLRSFKDGNNDGIGDFIGLTSKLDYFSDLGIDAIWVSPHYQSPMDDNGYDISDFYQVSNDYGTLEDVKEFIKQAHLRKIRVIFDLVLNHTSDEHEWFKAASDPFHPNHDKYHDYYIWQPPKYDQNGNMKKPTEWLSWFGGSVWDYNEPTNEYYLHIFSKKMPDLNWRNEDMKNDLKDITKWLIDLGVDGFRVDASNHLEKNWDFPEGYPGYEHFSSLPKHHEYLTEFGKEIFIPNDILAIGEAGGANKEEALKYCGFDSNEFNMLIQFGHCWQDVTEREFTTGKWSQGEINVKAIKESFNHWQEMLQGVGWNLIYWHNHDQPRVLSHYGNTQEYRNQSAKMLCNSLYFMPGTPIVYQGEEIGMTNVDYENLSDFRDVEVFTEYKNFIKRGATKAFALQVLRDRSRDNARTPFQWNDDVNAGFSKAPPWINVVRNYKEINYQRQLLDKDSIYNHYKQVLKMRKDYEIASGKMHFIDIDNNDSYIYINETPCATFLIISNFRPYSINLNLTKALHNFKLLLSNYGIINVVSKTELRPYESIVLIKK